jgi:hypothetical protein
MAMTTATTVSSIDRISFSLLSRLAGYLLQPARRTAAAPVASGLSFADIADVSIKATAKNGLQVRHVAPQKFRVR